MHAGIVVHCVLERELHVGLEEHLASPHDTLVEGHLDRGGGDVTKDGVEVVQSEGDQVARVVTHEHLRTSSSSGGQNVPPGISPPWSSGHRACPCCSRSAALWRRGPACRTSSSAPEVSYLSIKPFRRAQRDDKVFLLER